MCGRYRLSRRKQIVEEYFATVSGEEEWTPRYNIAPTQPVPVIRQNPKEPIRELSLVRWGLIPSWAKDPSVAAKMINARSETAATKPAFRDALKSRRCLIPADGFYDWSRTGKAKTGPWSQALRPVNEKIVRSTSSRVIYCGAVESQNGNSG
jgi:putative SOS response-associated peptidase YedK